MGKSSTPKTPDYEAAAKATAEGNLEYAKYATQANRADQYTPWGNLTWTNDRVFDQEAYDNAVAAYERGLSGGQTDTRQRMTGEDGRQYVWSGNTWIPDTGQPQSAGAGAPPDPEDFYTGGDKWTQNIELSPEMQALFDQEMSLQQGLFGSQNTALDRVNKSMANPFDTSGMPQRAGALDPSSLPQMGTALNYQGMLAGLPQRGTALDRSTLTRPDVFDPNSLTPMGDALRQSDLTAMGTALNVNRLPQMGEVFEGDRGFLSTYDPNLQTNNATQLLLRQMDPQMQQDRERLRTQLANQGITQGSAAYNNAMASFENNRNTAYRDAALQGIGLGMQQQSLQFNQGLQNRQLTAAEQAQRYQQQYGNRAMSAAEQAQQFAQMTQNRQLSAAEQAQLFNQMMGRRQMGAAEQAQVYGQQAGNYGLDLASQAQQFNQQNSLRTQEAQLAAELQAQRFQQQQALRSGEAALQNQQFAQSDAARNAAFQEAAYLRNLPMNELNALRTGNQVGMPQFPGYAQQATTGGPDLMGAANQQYQAQVAAANADNAAMSGLFGGLTQLGGLGLEYASLAGMFSDRRLKRNIRKVGKADNGLNIYLYQYVWGGPEQLGFMADEVIERYPHAVGTRDGYMTVDYGAL